jgi:hypothetical protein
LINNFYKPESGTSKFYFFSQTRKFIQENGLRLSFLLKQNILIGIVLVIRKIYLSRKSLVIDIPIDKEFQYSINIKSVIRFFEKKDEEKKKLIDLANSFVDGKVSIYQKSINLSKYGVDSFSKKRKDSNLFNKDIRFHWEVYRSKYLFNVGIAYFLSKNEKYAVSIIDHLQNWKNYCPVENDVVPYNGMEAAIKIINLSWIDLFLSKYEGYTVDTKKQLSKIIFVLAEYIYKNYDISFYGLESNHSISCNVGLIYAGIFLQKNKRSTKWYNFGMKNLKRNLKTQFTPDGINFESSVHYHRYVFETLVFIHEVLKNNKKDTGKYFSKRIADIGLALKKLTHVNGNISRFGDNDGGKFLYDFGSLDEFNNLNYLEYSGDTGSMRFENLTINKFYIPKLENHHSLPSLDRIGDYIVCKTDSFSLIATANNIGTKGKGNHQHNDFLSFELYGLKPFIVDPWSYTYTGDTSLRNKDRSVKSHNTIEIDGREIIEFHETRLFEMLGSIRTKVHYLEQLDGYSSFIISHDGYRNLKNGKQFHERSFKVSHDSGLIIITDSLKGKGFHQATIRFYIPKEYYQKKESDNSIIFYNNSEEFSISIDHKKPEVIDGFISNNFLNRSESYILYSHFNYENVKKINTSIKHTRL